VTVRNPCWPHLKLTHDYSFDKRRFIWAARHACKRLRALLVWMEARAVTAEDECRELRARIAERDTVIEQLKSDIYSALDEGRWDEWDRAVDTWGRSSGRPDDVRLVLEGALER
jgi:hypothetical protein